MASILIRLFDLRRENLRQALLLFGALMCVAGSGLCARTVGDTLFLTRYGAGWICYMYLATALTVSAAALFLRRLAGRYPLHILMTGFALTMGVVGLIFRAALLGETGWLPILIYLWADVVATLVIVQFWVLAGSAFNAREAKRLFAFIGIGGTLSGVIFGFLIRNYVRAIGAENLLLVVAALLATFTVLVHMVGGGVVVGAKPGKTGRAAKKASSSQTAQARTIGAMVVVAMLALTLVDYQFKAGASAQYPKASDLASFFGVFYAYNSVASLVLQAFFVSRILKRGGLLVSLLILPCSMLIGSAAILTSAAFGAVVATKFAHILLMFTIDNTALQILYLSVPVQTRGQARTFIDGVLRPGALGLAGLVLILIITHVAASLVSLIVLPLVLAWCVLGAVNFRGYLGALMDSLRQGRFELSQEEGMSDEASVKVLAHLVETGTDDEVAYMFELVGQMKDLDFTPQALIALGRDDPRIKALGLEYLLKQDGHREVPGIQNLLRHTDPDVRARAVALACIRPGSKDLALAYGLLGDSDASVRAEAAAGLMRCGGEEGFNRAWPTMTELALSPDAESRNCAAGALGRSGPSGKIREPLLRLLQDETPEVQIAALGSLESVKPPEGIPAALSLLGQDLTYDAAARALAAYGDLGVEALRAEASPDSSGRLGPAAARIPAVLARIGTRSAFAVLRGLFSIRVDSLRHSAIDAACRLLRERPTLRSEVGDLEEVLLSEGGRSRVLKGIKDEIRELRGTELLVESVEEMRTASVHRIFAVLSVLYPQADVEAIRRGVMEGTGDLYANAVEVLENTLSGRLRERLLPAVVGSPERREESMKSAVARLCALGEWHDYWLRVCAIHAAGRGRNVEALPEVEEALESPDWLERETALWAMGQIVERGTFEGVRLRRLGDPDEHVSALAAAMG